MNPRVTIASQAARVVRRSKLASLFVDMLRVLLTHPYWLTASIISTVVNAALAPSQAWLWKKFLDNIKASGVDSSVFLKYVLVFGGLHAILGLLGLIDKVLNRAYDLRQVIKLQRTYLERRQQEEGSQDISRLLFDCDKAKGGLDLIYKDSWHIVAGIVSVLIWQLRLAPQWIPALIMGTVLPVLLVFAFGRFIQSASQNILHLQSRIAASTSEREKLELFSHQESFFRQSVKLEFFLSGTDTVMEVMKWLGLLLLIVISLVFHLKLLPEEIKPGDLILFAMNIDSLSKPVGDFGKLYSKARQAYPALRRVLQPDTIS
ncbi:ABC transporter ATP-binding protein [Brasilonema sp. CT11]|nr:ABC transporter ATP-binding protein [Brasilonema sp. CT11]